MLDITQMLRPFFWLMVGIAAVAPLVILVARRARRRFS
jgi:hypothetical protein